MAGNIGYKAEQSPTLSAVDSGSNRTPCVLVLNDQGGGVMNVSYNVTSTLRSQMKHHEPIVLIDGGARAVHQNGSGEVRVSETAYTVSTNSNPSGRNTPLVWIYDARGNGGGRVSPTITGDHQDRITDYTAIVVEKKDEQDIC